MDKQLVVKKSNELVMSNYNLSLIEHRFLNMCLGRIYKRDNIRPETKCYVFLERYMKEFKITEKEALSQFKKIKRSLATQKVRNLGVSSDSINLVEEISFETNKEIYVKFNSDFIEHISLLENHFTSFNLEEVAGFTSEHTFRIYEICKSVAHDAAKWELSIGVENLKLILGLKNKYSQYGSFKRMINESIEEINSKTSITVTIEESKLYKKVAKIFFKLKKTKNQDKAY